MVVDIPLQSIVCMLTAAFNQFVNPWAIDSIGWWYYLVYCGWLIGELVFVITFVVETKGDAFFPFGGFYKSLMPFPAYSFDVSHPLHPFYYVYPTRTITNTSSLLTFTIIQVAHWRKRRRCLTAKVSHRILPLWVEMQQT